MSILNEIFNQIQGLEADAALVLGPGFVREEFKTLCFQRGFSLKDTAILPIQSVALSLVPESQSRVMAKSARVELLREAFRSPELRNALPILGRNRTRSAYFDKIDQTLQAGRMNFAHATEAQVILDRLVEKTGNLAKREEFFLLNRYWERLLELRGLWDEARVYEVATQKISNPLIESSHLQLKSGLKSKYFRLEHMPEKPRVESFWSEISRRSEVVKIHSSEILNPSAKEIHLSRKKAHSLEDAAHFILDDLLKGSENDLSSHAVVIQDSPVIRRTLKRVAEQRGVSLLDPRDPTLVSQSEMVKRALLDLELCAKGFQRAQALEWLSAFHPKAKEYRKKIIDQAVVQDMDRYQMIPDLFSSFQELKKRYPSRMALLDLKKQLLASIKNHELSFWCQSVFEKLFEEWEASLSQIDSLKQVKPIRFWLEQVKEKLTQVNPIVEPVKNRFGLKLYRVDQFRSLLLTTEKVHFFGIDSSYFEPNPIQSEWFGTRDQEILSSEFGWVSSQNRSAQNAYSFHSWCSESSISWEYEYDESGSEVEGLPLNFQVEMIGSHPQMAASWSGTHAQASQSVELGNVCTQDSEKHWPFSFIKDYGNCPFVAYAQHLLKLQDERDVEVNLAADRFGTLMHSALEEVMQNQSPEVAFEIAWKKTPLTAWEKNDRWYESIRTDVIKTLECFLVDDAHYREKSNARLLHMEKEVLMNVESLSLRGRVDRIDEHDDGLVVIDYKTGGVLSNGLSTVETGKDLQLGLYALAVQDTLKNKVISAQYLKLETHKISRNTGFFFSQWNKGKKEHSVEYPLTFARSDSKSLFEEPPHQIWSKIQQRVQSIAQAISQGHFPANPVDSKDCARCRFEGVCGEMRR